MGQSSGTFGLEPNARHAGKLLVRCSKDFSMPPLGKRYLLSLKFNPITGDFHILTGYQLEATGSMNLRPLR
jgi:hypothetical protein